MKRILAILTLLSSVAPLAAQDPATIEVLAPILMSEDRRVIDAPAIGRALEHPDPFVRRMAVRAVGRIGSPAGLALILPRLDDADQQVITETFFAIGLIGHAGGVGPTLDRLRRSDSLGGEAVYEAAAALARIGGETAATALNDVISGSGDIPRSRRDQMLGSAMINAWRLGATAPTAALLRYADDRDVDLRWRAIYSLGRVLAPGAGDPLVDAVRDESPLVRETAARYLTARFADSANVSRSTATSALGRALLDREMGVRINALGALGSYRDSALVELVLPLLDDSERQVRIAAISALVQLGGAGSAPSLAALLDRATEPWGVRSAALAALASLDPAGFAGRIARWTGSTSVPDRLAGIAAIRSSRSPDVGLLSRMTSDADPRVRAAALSAWRGAAGGPDPLLADAARGAADDQDPMVRAAAVPILVDSMDAATAGIIASLWRRGGSEVREALISAVARLARRDSTVLGRVAAGPAAVMLERPDDAALRQYLHRTLPAVSARWGGVGPIETGRVLQDYREFVRVFLMGTENPRVVIDVESRGPIEIELLARDAPLTVANFLMLVDRRYFDASRWHRVVPNFVIQDGDPTGTGSGGPGWQIRDEINRQRYDVPMLGMALSGPDTGGSQWFINLSPQPHLDGSYTIFGKVVGSYSTVRRVLQGDVIRTIRRAR